jgi:hypothetical protein
MLLVLAVVFPLIVLVIGAPVALLLRMVIEIARHL